MDSIMAFSSIFKKATSLFGLGGDELKHPPLDGEIIYCKNNVCVHPPAPLVIDSEHHPGYLTLRSQNHNGSPTLVLTWIPNSSLRKNPRSIQNSPNTSVATTPTPSPRRTPRQEFSKLNQPITTPSPTSSPRESSDGYEHYYMDRGPVKGKKKLSIDNASVNSEVSFGSRDDSQSVDSWTNPDDTSRKLSCSNKSDSGIGTEEILQNNEKNIPCGPQKLGKIPVGVNVNDLHNEKDKNSDLKNVNRQENEEEISSPDTSDGLTPEEQLAALLNRNKLHAKARERLDSNKAVSIEMDGDNLVITTEEIEKDVDSASKDRLLEDRNINKNESKFETSSSSNSQSTDADGISFSSDSTQPSPSNAHYNRMITELKEGLNQGDTDKCDSSTNYDSSDTVAGSVIDTRHSRKNVPTDLKLNSSNTSDNNTQNCSITTPDISVTRCRLTSSSSGSTSGPDSEPPSPCSSIPNSPLWGDNQLESPSSSDSTQVSHNLTFPHNAVTYSSGKKEKKSVKDQVCGVFSVDLGQMRSLRLFYSDPECTRGQVVIASRESQYKILHFHHGGLDKLADIFKDWNLFAQTKEKHPDKPYKQFLIVRPHLTDDQCHPEEGVYSVVTEDMWQRHMNAAGQIEEDFQLRKNIFFGGLDPCLRHETWPFLLQYYPFESTDDEREQIRNDKYIEYQNIRKHRESMDEESQEKFFRTIQCTVEKDVVRTDRSHPYFRGENNPNIDVLKSILLNYAVANPNMGYTQGMSDLCAPVLAEIQNEVDAFWCFVGLMQNTIFVSSPKDSDMDKQLSYLRELLRLMQYKFYIHLEKLGDDAMELLFCHRWILLCFKREFPETDALKIWEACWSHYQTDYFHLFICVAIVSIYGEDVIDQNLPADEILLHFSSLAMHMEGDLVLRKARGLLHQFRKIPKIPCTLHGLCSLCGMGMWDSGHVPIVECVGDHQDGVCPYSSQPNSPVHN